MDPAAPALRETAYAKINLALHVRERMADGYHRIETLFAFCEDGDVLRVEPGAQLRLAIDGPFADALDTGPDNLVMRAAQALRNAAAIDAGAEITLTKNLPIASGIGGGSADAAAALRLLCRFWDVAIEDSKLHDIAFDLGADVPACLVSHLCHGDGRGDELRSIDATGLVGRPVLLVNPRIYLETGPVFATWDGVDRGPLGYAEPLRLDAEWRNDLEAPARSIAPEIVGILTRLETMPGADFIRMSGSGATCFALFDTVASRDAAADSIAATQPDWWIMASRLR